MKFGYLLLWLLLPSISFVAGLYVGEEQSAVELKPCPQAGKASLIRATVTGQVCTYAEIVRGGRKFKWEVRTL